MISTQAMNALKTSVSEFADRTDARGEALLEAMEHLERGRDGKLDLVLFPKNSEELQALIYQLNEYKLPSTTIAGRTGLVEAQRAQGIAISTSRMNAPLALILKDGAEIKLSASQDGVSYTDQLEYWRDELAEKTKDCDLTDAAIHVQAGVAIDAINGRPSTADEPGGYPGILQAISRKVPIVMASTPTATIGATVANGSAGANAIRYGTAADMAVWVEAVLGTGEIVRQENRKSLSLKAKDDKPLIRSDRFSHDDSAIGSQGAFSIITEAAVRTYPVPKEQVITLFPVESCAVAQEILAQAREYFSGDGEAIELFELIRGDTLMRAKEHAQKRTQTKDGANYYLLMQLISEVEQPESEFFPDHSAFFEKMAMFFMDGLKNAEGEIMFPDAEGVDYDSNPHRLMAIREAASEKSHGKTKRAYDVVLPLNRLDEFVGELEALGQGRYPDLQLEVFGHAGVGALHIHFIGERALDAASLDSDVFDLTQSLHGSPWAEHGVGSKWGAEWQKRTSQTIQDEMIGILKKNDPNNVVGSYLFGFNVYYSNE